MKNSVKSNVWKVILSFFVFVNVLGCGEMLDDPTIDKDTGEDINLLIVDFNFFTTRMSYKFIDASDNAIITKPAKMWFTGLHANDIVNFAGEKNAEYTSSEGQMELTVDPNLDISASNPMEFAVNVEIDGYLPLSHGIKINSEGKKTFELVLTKETDGEEVTLEGEENGDSYVFSFAPVATKSAKLNEYEIEYSIKTGDILKFKNADGNTFSPINNISLTLFKYDDFRFIVTDMIIGGTSKSTGFQNLEMGTLIKIVINGQRVFYLEGGTVNLAAKVNNATDVLGFAERKVEQATGINKWHYTGLMDTLDAFGEHYDFIRASTKEVSALGSNIKFSSNSISSFSIDADIMDLDGNLIKTTNFKGNFPETFILENVPAHSAIMHFRNNNPSFDSIPPLEISDLSTGNYEVDVNATEDYEEYQIVLKATCKENPTIAVAPTYSGEVRIKGTKIWQGVDMIGGKVDLLAKSDQDYELKLIWEDKPEISEFGTRFDASGKYINNTSSDITSEKMNDGRTRIKVTHKFDQDICDDMDW